LKRNDLGNKSGRCVDYSTIGEVKIPKGKTGVGIYIQLSTRQGDAKERKQFELAKLRGQAGRKRERGEGEGFCGAQNRPRKREYPREKRAGFCRKDGALLGNTWVGKKQFSWGRGGIIVNVASAGQRKGRGGKGRCWRAQTHTILEGDDPGRTSFGKSGPPGRPAQKNF